MYPTFCAFYPESSFYARCGVYSLRFINCAYQSWTMGNEDEFAIMDGREAVSEAEVWELA